MTCVTEPEKLHMVLLDNAYDSLNESLAKAELAEHREREWKFAVLHLVHALELMLKERLRQEHHLLVFQNVDKSGTPELPGSTVSLEHALGRLQRIGIAVDPADTQAIMRAVQWRNKITHYEFEVFLQEVRANYALLFEFLHSFHLRELGSEILQHVEADHQMKAAEIMRVFQDEFVEFHGVPVIRSWPAQLLAAQGIRDVELRGRTYQRIPWGQESLWGPEHPFPAEHVCHDCACVLGQLHEEGCCVQECPRCHGQYISCDCPEDDDVEN